MDPSEREQIAKRDQFRCRGCGKRTSGQVHHIITRGRGGSDSPSNLITLCGRCHMIVSPVPVRVMEKVWGLGEAELLIEKARVELAIHRWVLNSSTPEENTKGAEAFTVARSPRESPDIPEWKRERPRAGTGWNAEEDQTLLREFQAGTPMAKIALQLGRGTFAVEVRLCKLGYDVQGCSGKSLEQLNRTVISTSREMARNGRSPSEIFQELKQYSDPEAHIITLMDHFREAFCLTLAEAKPIDSLTRSEQREIEDKALFDELLWPAIMKHRSEWEATLGQQFLAFWRLNTVDAALRAGQPLNYAASNHYSRVKKGDAVWLVSVRAGRLRLIGRIIVAEVTDRDGATRIVGETGLWSADHYILPAEATIRPVADIDIHHLVPDLRFAGSNPRLTPNEEGLVSGQQFQAMRRLAGNSARLLAEALDGEHRSK